VLCVLRICSSECKYLIIFKKTREDLNTKHAVISTLITYECKISSGTTLKEMTK